MSLVRGQKGGPQLPSTGQEGVEIGGARWCGLVARVRSLDFNVPAWKRFNQGLVFLVFFFKSDLCF